VTVNKQGTTVPNYDWNSKIVATDGQQLLMYYLITKNGVTYESVAVFNVPSSNSPNTMAGHFFQGAGKKSRYGTVTF
jgi:hypothetical protein